MMEILALLAVLLVSTVDAGTNNNGCSISIREDFSPIPPLLLHHGGDKHGFVYPQSQGRITLQHNQKMRLGCPGSVISVAGKAQKVDSIIVQCESGKSFSIVPENSGKGKNTKNNRRNRRATTGQITNVNYELNRFGCSKVPEPNIKKDSPEPKCLNGKGKHRAIAFTLLSNEETYELIDYCTLHEEGFRAWAHTKIQPWLPIPPSERVEWSDRDTFSRAHQREVFNIDNQERSLKKVLGAKTAFINSKTGMFLSRGHLVANADMHYPSMRYATYDYVNSLPQWYTINDGNWKDVEIIVRNMATSLNHDIDVWTGGLEIMQMRSSSTAKMVDLYLNKHADRVQPIPIPKYLFKIVYDSHKNEGVVFMTIHQPFLTDNDQTTNFIKCGSTDICDQIPMMKTRLPKNKRTNFQRGYTYCCDIDSFMMSFPELNVQTFNHAKLLKV